MNESTQQSHTQSEPSDSSEMPKSNAPKSFVAYTRFADVEEKLETLFNEKGPFAIPESIKDLIVTVAPWAALAAFVFCLPIVLAALGISAVFAPLAILMGGVHGGVAYFVSIASAIATMFFLGRAIPGLFNKTSAGWKFTVYGYAVYFLHALFMIHILSALFTVLWVYVLFQVKYNYKQT